MLAFSCGADWEPTDPDSVLDEGFLGYEKLQLKYGLTSERLGQERIFDPIQFVVHCKELLSGERYPNRTLMYELFGRVRFKEPLMQAFKDKLEEVTIGTLDWDKFVAQGLQILERIQAKRSSQE